MKETNHLVHYENIVKGKIKFKKEQYIFEFGSIVGSLDSARPNGSTLAIYQLVLGGKELVSSNISNPPPIFKKVEDFLEKKGYNLLNKQLQEKI